MALKWIQCASILMFLAVSLGAFGAHGLKNKLSPYLLDTYKTAVFYHSLHALALFIVAWLSTLSADPKISWAGIFFILGILFFSGSLYVLAVTEIRWIGFLTPIGGSCFLIGWLLICWLSVKI
jgi:uncharacterized membrane protein YgdD (TMEM256/DUF423 family)